MIYCGIFCQKWVDCERCSSSCPFQYASPRLWNQLPAPLRQPRTNLSNSASPSSKQNCCKSGSSLMIADPLWSCRMLLCGPLWVFCGSFVVLCGSFAVLCGPLRYLVIPGGLAYLENISDSCHVLYPGSTFVVYFVY